MIKRIVVPTDFSGPSIAAIRFAVALGARAGADVFVAHMIEVPLLPETTFGIQVRSVDQNAMAKLRMRAENRFNEIQLPFTENVKVHFHTIEDEMERGLLEFIQTFDIDQVVMSTKGASGFDEFLVGSAAGRIARLSPVPVLSLPREVRLESIRNIVFPSLLEPDQDEMMDALKELQELLKARLHILLVNTPNNFFNDNEAQTRLESFAKQYDLRNSSLNFRSNEFARTGIIQFKNEINADAIVMATHGRTGLSHVLKGSTAEQLIDIIDCPIWTWKNKK